MGRSPGEGKGYPFQYVGLENSRDCIVHGVAKSWTWLSDFHSHVHWVYPAIASSVAPFFFCMQSFLASGYFPLSQLFTSGGQSTGASASASVLPVDIQDWLPLGLIDLHAAKRRRSRVYVGINMFYCLCCHLVRKRRMFMNEVYKIRCILPYVYVAMNKYLPCFCCPLMEK